MKKLLSILVINTVAIWITAEVLDGVSYSNAQTLLFAAAALGIANLVVRPLAKLITMPLNIITLGAFSGLITVLMLYLVTQIVVGFQVVPFYFEGCTRNGFVVPAMQITLFWSLFLTSLLITLVSNMITWIFDL